METESQKWRTRRWQESLKSAFVAKQKTREKNRILGYLNYRCHAPKFTHTESDTHIQKTYSKLTNTLTARTHRNVGIVSARKPKWKPFISLLSAHSNGRVPLTERTKAKEMIIFSSTDTEISTCVCVCVDSVVEINGEEMKLKRFQLTLRIG